MSSLDEKRVHVSDTDPETAIVASETGVANVSLAGGRVGGVSLLHRDSAADAATCGECTMIATDAGVLELVGEETRALDGGGGGDPNSASAVDIDGSGRVLAGSDGELFRWDTTGNCHQLGAVGEIRSIDAPLVASREGVYRITGDELWYSGLDDVFDVASRAPYAATAEGLYVLANGWTDVLKKPFSVVTAGPGTADSEDRGRAHAVGEGGVYERTESGWQRRPIPTDEACVAVAYGEGTYAVTGDGTFLIDDGDEWRTHPLGLRGVRALAVRSD